MSGSSHENLVREEHLSVGSDRSFGIVMAGVFSLLTVINVWHNGHTWHWTLRIAAIFLATSLLYPSVLHPLNLAWAKFGLLLHKIVNPIIMGFLFYGTVVPIGFLMRAMGKDLLQIRLKPDADSYWIVRQPSGPASETMKDQF